MNTHTNANRHSQADNDDNDTAVRHIPHAGVDWISEWERESRLDQWVGADWISDWEKQIEPVSPLNRAKSGKIGHFQTFEVWTFVPVIFWFLVVCMVKTWSDRKKKVGKKIPGTKITRYYLRRHLHRLGGSRRQLAQIRPKTSEHKLCLFWLIEPLIKV